MALFKLVRFWLLWAIALISCGGYCATIKDIIDGLDVKYNGQCLDILFKPVPSQEGSTTELFAYDSLLVQRRTYDKTIAGANPYVEITDQFATNIYKSYREGGTLADGRRVADEADFRNEEPVTGVALFVSPFYQARLLLLLRDPAISDGNVNGENVYVVKGNVTVQGRISLAITLSFAKSDFLLLRQDITSQFGGGNLTATRDKVSNGNWKYSSVYSELVSPANNVLRSGLPFAVKPTQSEMDVDANQLSIPNKTIITDYRFGYQVRYVLGQLPALADADIAKMATDPDYRTNSYYLHFYHVAPYKSAPTPPAAKHYIILGTLVLTGVLPLLAYIWSRCRRVKLQ